LIILKAVYVENSITEEDANT